MKATNRFRVIQDVPTYSVGQTIYATTESSIENFLKYPRVFTRIYTTIDGVDVCFGDPIFRIVRKGYDDKVKAVTFTDRHLDTDLSYEVYGSIETANKELENIEKRAEKVRAAHYYKENLNTIQYLSNVDWTNVNLERLKTNLETINKIAKNLLNGN